MSNPYRSGKRRCISLSIMPPPVGSEMQTFSKVGSTEYSPSEQRKISELCSLLPAKHQHIAREAVARALANVDAQH